MKFARDRSLLALVARKTGGLLTRQNGTTVTGTITQNAALTPVVVQSSTLEVTAPLLGREPAEDVCGVNVQDQGSVPK